MYVLFRPTTNAIMGLTVANYVLQPFFPGNCEVPPLAAQLIAATLICMPNVLLFKLKLNYIKSLFLRFFNIH